jgi:NADH dehydrogenase
MRAAVTIATESAEMIGLDRAKRQAYVAPTHDEDGLQIIPPRVLGYDTLVVAVGSLSNDFGTPGVAEHATGVELAAELHKTMRDLASYNLDAIDFDMLIKIDLIEAAPRILPALPGHIAAGADRVLRQLAVTIRTGTRVTEVGAAGVTLHTGEVVPAELIVWAAGIKAPDFLRDLDGLEADRINRLVVRPTLQTTRDDDVFAIGDCAACTLPGSDTPLPPRAQTAQQQADFLIKVINARMSGGPLPSFRYRDCGSLVSLGDYHALGVVLRGLKIEGLLAKFAHRSLHKMHLRALHGTPKVVLDSLAKTISGRTEPRIKLH